MISLNVEQAIAEFRSGLAALLSRESESCPFCGRTVSGLQKREAGIHALPCFHRIAEGEIPAPWIEESKNNEEGVSHDL